MQIKQAVEIKADTICVWWNGLEVLDAQENLVNVKMTDEQYISLADRLNDKVARIKKDRREKLQKELEEMEDAESYS
jgi:hypothetical protein